MKILIAAIRRSAQRACCCFTLLIPALSVAAVLPGAPLAAQTGSAAHPADRASHRYRTLSLDDRVEALAKSLDLDEAQRSAVRSILAQRAQQIWQARRTPSSDSSALIDRIRAIEEKTVERIRATLNQEQQKKYEPLGARASVSVGHEKTVEDWLKEIGPR